MYCSSSFQHPLVPLQPLQSTNDGLLDRQFRAPTGGFHLVDVEEDERVVPNPAAVAAGILEARLHAQMVADAADRVVDLHVFIGAEVVGFDAMLRPPRGIQAHHVQDGVKAILNVKVGLPLRAVPEDFQVVRMFQQLAVEIKDVAVGVAFA